ncbi:MAG: STN domain-containing protein, partial [Fimbriimonas ginsengisoli]|nr:STN domain-containing protein [Fimbriimonas ginsengisoli]
MRLVIVACAALVLAGQAAWAQNEGSISLAFSDTEVAQVLKAIGVRTGASIVYSGQDKLPITLNVKADSLEDAIRSVVSAAGLSYRKVNRTYVVAKPDALRQALQPFSYRIALDPTGDPVQAFKMLEDAYPQASVKLLGERILFFGVPEDI